MLPKGGTILWLLLLVVLIIQHADLLKLQSPSLIYSEITKLISRVTAYHRCQNNTVIVITTNEKCAADAADYFVNDLSPSPVIITTRNDVIYRSNVVLRLKHIVAFVDTVADIEEILYNVRRYRIWNIRGFIHLIICSPVSNREWLENTSKRIWKMDILNSVISYFYNDTLETIGYDPFEDKLYHITST